MKTKLFLYFSLLILVLSGCNKKELDITMHTVNSGNLNVTVTDENGNGLANLNVIIKEYWSSSSIEEKETDASGHVEFKDILYGNYQLVIENVEIGGTEYNVIQPIQVINGATKEYDIVPSDYSGTATIRVIDNWGDPIEDINVAIFNSDDYDNRMNFDDVMGIVLDTRLTDASGEAVFTQIPFGQYGIMVYNDNSDYEIQNYAFYIDQKGDETTATYNY